MEKIEDLKKFTPKERLARLREIEKRNKEEIELARKLIGESEREVAIEEEMKEIPIPEVKAVDIDSLFSPEAKDIFRMKRFVDDRTRPAEEEAAAKKEKPLEETVREEARELREEEAKQQVQYGTALESKDMAEKLAGAYDTIKNLVEKEREMYLTKEERNRLDNYQEIAKNLYEEKFMPGNDEEKNRVLAAERLLYDTRIK